ncbi:2-hydroxyacid dehydrogenase [Phenylobacterium immobile]|uniref:2-hydroxyacid dehydrogenase n=1 Tax=Phenylobacterium immobile TaxID=21 RepID=UPI000AD5D973|nr:2-hydroxyacid dehydrogenase [Phenylobacterium immobile]
MSNKPVVVIADVILDRFSGLLEADYELARPWTSPSFEAFIAGPGAGARAMVTVSGKTPPAEILSQFPDLGLIACASTGFEGLDLDWCQANSVLASNGAGANAFDVADQAVGLLIAAYRRFTEGGQIARRGGWSLPGLSSRSLRGKRVGIVGMGRIGRAIAKRIDAFDIQVSWLGPNPKPDLAYPRAESLLALAESCDALILTALATPETEKMINREVIDALGPQGVIVNVARGSLVDELALIAALREGRLWAAGLDVFEEEPSPAERWVGVPNLEAMPHSAGATPEGMQAVGDLLAENLRCFFAGKPLASPIR